ncbi:MAG: hypothetical protein IKD23_06895 [Lentisphaeria bacterium]|nr:hypothetical protein [Lentisphaeria bacterium]
MKKLSIILSVMFGCNIFAAEVDVDGDFNNFKRSWALSTQRIGTAELIRENGVNFVQLASENNKKGQIGIYTARGIAAEKGDRISISADIKGGPVTISIIEYGNKKFLANQVKKFPQSDTRQNCSVAFTVENPKTDLIRVSFKVLKGAVATVSNVKADMSVSGEEGK